MARIPLETSRFVSFTVGVAVLLRWEGEKGGILQDVTAIEYFLCNVLEE